MKYLMLTIFVLGSLGQASFADDSAFLDPPYENHFHPVDLEIKLQGDARPSDFNLERAALKSQSDTESVIAIQTSVKAQGSRGTCSIFSATALLEAMMVKQHELDPKGLNLSEEWLEYIIMRNRTSDGSNSSRNFEALRRYGSPEEKTLPYIGETWKKLSDSRLARKRCGHLEGNNQTSCLLGHRDPVLLNLADRDLSDPSNPLYDLDFIKARNEAAEIRDEYIEFSSRNYYMASTNSIKDALRKGTPLTLGIEFFYGAWNHRKTTELGIPRNMKQWDLGVVTYPERNSVDRIKSATKRAGHSVVIVGYDDELEVTNTVLMADGSEKTVTYKGVYYFKNSWGKDGFGRKFQFNGKTYRGYGMIIQKYAHEQGTFYRMPLKR